MSKLYPPEIGGTLPAFYEQRIVYKNSENKNVETDGLAIKIPFIMNKTVASSEVTGFNLIIRSVANSKLLGYLRTESLDQWDLENNYVYFYIPKSVYDTLGSAWYNKLFTGLHYKMQLAYINKNNIIGHYSSVGIAKYITKPEVGILNLQENSNNNMAEQIFIGTYSQEHGDVTEKVYNYQFNIYDIYGKLYYTSGEQLHNSFTDENGYSSIDKFVLHKDLIENEVYKIQYIVNTTNNATFASPLYKIVQKTTVNPELQARLSVSMNYNNGYIDIRLVGDKDRNGQEYPATGRFILKRGCSKDGYAEWNTILNFELNGKYPSRWLWRDFTVEHGYSYKYALQQFNDFDMYSNKIYSEEVYAAFEDVFLYDGKRQLKMRFNPKITSFKDTLLETKTNTMGNKFPYTFRNGKVMYKEFPINGLISYFSDEEELFISKEEILLQNETTNLIDENVMSERLFKLKVLEFFNNGEPKLFRSPVEGNYIVKLTNVNMTPTDQVSRMLHSITGNAYEIADFNYENLYNMNFIQWDDVSDNKITRWMTVPLSGEGSPGQNGEVLNHSPIHHIKIENVLPGTLFTIVYDTKPVTTAQIAVGATGTYEAYSETGITSLRFDSRGPIDGVLTYQYEETSINVFDRIKDVDLLTYPAVQWFGPKRNLLEEFGTVEVKLLSLLYMRFYKREVYTIYCYNDNGTDKYYWDKLCSNEVKEEEYDKYCVYRVIDANPTKDDYNISLYEGPPVYFIIDEGISKFEKDISFAIEIQYKDGQIVVIDLAEIEFYNLAALEDIVSIKIPIGVWSEGGVYLKKYEYNVPKCENLGIGEIAYPILLKKENWVKKDSVQIQQVPMPFEIFEDYGDIFDYAVSFSKEGEPDRIMGDITEEKKLEFQNKENLLFTKEDNIVFILVYPKYIDEYISYYEKMYNTSIIENDIDFENSLYWEKGDPGYFSDLYYMHLNQAKNYYLQATEKHKLYLEEQLGGEGNV